ncbi:MAG: UbiA family prenyltransferase [Promethearchaeota archaeon]
MKNYFLLLKSSAKIMPIVHWILSIMLGITLVDEIIPLFLIALSSISFIFAWFFTVGINDYYDVDIDAITNPERPLITRKLTKNDVKMFFIVSGVISLALGGIIDILNQKIGVVILGGVFLLLGILYSMPPIRLKGKTPLSSFVIGVVTSECILAGGVLVGLTGLGILYACSLGFLVTFISAAKDLKDIEGDRADDVPTISTVYGPKKAALVFQIINTIGYSSILLFYFFQPLPWILIVLIISIIILNLILFQRFKSNPSKANGKLIYGVGFSLYMILSVLLLIFNLTS